MKTLIKNHSLKNRQIIDEETQDIYCVEDVYEMGFAGNSYISLLVFQPTEGARRHGQIDWEMTQQEEDSDIGTHWQSHIEDNRKRYKLIEDV